MRKFDWLAWAFLLSVGAFVAAKFPWFKTQYVTGARWAIDGWHWAGEHHPILYAVTVAFGLGLLLGWVKNNRLVDRTIKALALLTAEKTALEQLARELTRQNADLQQEVQRLAPDPRSPVAIPLVPFSRHDNHDARQAAKPKRKKKAEGVPSAAEPRAWQERLLDDDFDHIDEPKPAQEEVKTS